ncbi:inositol monophosphatase family protein [Mesobacillus subterraneus]|uniref:inositol-phosphate phosphatase n=1 Tax=Mesobacillus subterraneus TaxID=285983 RepID=A0A3R9EBJ7_9BACI|nr:inositol monophosphatase family protein [Mesobacillus subterraneus]RSD28166.1 inositol monophosphatase family protein [Mesobacillus subterraneus]
MNHNLKEIYTYAMEWTKEAGENIRASFPKTLNVTSKSNPNDLVTDIDKGTEQYFIEKIKGKYPDHRIMGEEGYGDEVTGLSGVVWIIDPIDGTMNFVHQQRNFAISVGIYVDGEGMIGLIYDVVHDELYHCIKGNGVLLNDKPIPELKESRVSEAVIALNALWVAPNKRIDHQMFIPLVQDVRGTRSYGSAAMEMVYVATGRIDAYLSPRLAPWDIAAGIILIKELGGEATDLRGNELDLLKENSLFVSKPGLHSEILKHYLKDGKW